MDVVPLVTDQLLMLGQLVVRDHVVLDGPIT